MARIGYARVSTTGQNLDMQIDWRIPTDKVLLSEKDTKHPLLRDFQSPFIYGKL